MYMDMWIIYFIKVSICLLAWCISNHWYISRGSGHTVGFGTLDLHHEEYRKLMSYKDVNVEVSFFVECKLIKVSFDL